MIGSAGSTDFLVFRFKQVYNGFKLVAKEPLKIVDWARKEL